MKHRLLILSIIIGILLLVLTTGAYKQQNKIIFKRKGCNAELADAAFFRQSKNVYEITKGKSTLQYPETEIEYVKPPEPKGMEDTEDIPTLERIMKNYYKLWWDAEAFSQLIPLYIKQGEPDKAIKLFQQKDQITDKDIPVPVYRAYWQALIASHQDSVLQEELADAISHGSREEAAWACIAMGDFLMSKGDAKQALVNGYLRIVLLFRDIKSARKEALTGAIAAYEKLGDSKAAELRKILKEEYQ